MSASAEAMRKQRKTKPWISRWYLVKRRCENPSVKSFKNYGGKGVRCLITMEEIKALWYRDKAFLMKRPSIDRINPDGNYEMANCRFIELVENVRRSLGAMTLVPGRKCFRGHYLTRADIYIRPADKHAECRKCKYVRWLAWKQKTRSTGSGPIRVHKIRKFVRDSRQKIIAFIPVCGIGSGRDSSEEWSKVDCKKCLSNRPAQEDEIDGL